MKKWGTVIASIVIIGLGFLVYSSWAVKSYIPQANFYDFPIPKSATIINIDESKASYSWDAARFEYGLPFAYRQALKKNDWEQLPPIDTIQVYEKDGNVFHVLVSTNLIEVSKENEKMPMTEPEPDDWFTFIQPIRAYMYYRTQAVIQQDIEILWSPYPALKTDNIMEQGINTEEEEVKTYHNRPVIDANVDLEGYDRIKINKISDEEVIVQVHGSITYMDKGFEESGGELLMDVYLQKRGDDWTVVKTDLYTDVEYKEWLDE